MNKNYVLGDPQPHAIIFFWNGVAAVTDQYGQQMPHFQVGKHRDTIKVLEDAGIDWKQLHVTGQPQ